jgi:hypothetical protein
MPFVSHEQRKACYAQQRRMNEQGLESKWDCKKFEKEEPRTPRSSPRTSRRTKKPRVTPKKLEKKNGEQVFVGIRGGKFVIRKNKKVYL